MDTFSYRQLSILGGFLVGAGYILTGLFADSIWYIFITYSLSGKSKEVLTLALRVNYKTHSRRCVDIALARNKLKEDI